jgi:glycosyltransferase involved in cell wall biosynthesis
MSGGMKVLMTADAVGGVWTYAVELSRALAAHGIEVMLAIMGAPLAEDQRAQAATLRNVRVEEGPYRLEWMADPWEDVWRAGEWLLELEQRERPTVVHLNGYAHGALAWSAPVCMVAHSCVLSWWRAARGGNVPAAWDTYRRAVRRGINGADIVVAPSAAMLAMLRECHGAPAAARVIYNGRDATRFRPARKEPLVLTVGRLWDEAKNVAAVDRVAPGIPWPVYVAGAARGPDGDAQELANVRHLGCLDEQELAAWMGRAAVYALPARYEPFGLTALEAALAGCALVVGDIASLREIWGDAALYVEPNDHDALRHTLRRLAGDASFRSVMARRARACARRYTPARMAAEYRGLYDALAAGTMRGREGACAS